MNKQGHRDCAVRGKHSRGRCECWEERGWGSHQDVAVRLESPQAFLLHVVLGEVCVCKRVFVVEINTF